jgi:diaminopimelate epimerase
MRVEFTKMHGAGNDFVVIEDLDSVLELAPEQVRQVCDRHFGVGADGLILVRRAASTDAASYMHFHNSDGSLAEMCGNGIRCLAKYLADAGLVTDSPLTVQTLGGDKEIHFTRGRDGLVDEATVDMGPPVLTPADIPADFEGEMVFECPIETAGGTFTVTALSMGNPHAVVFVQDVQAAPVTTAGPAIEHDTHFPSKTNVEFVEYVGGEEDRLRVRVWERGVGETLACGTGACAATVAAALACEIGREATVELPGGELRIRWAGDDRVFLTGPATTVYQGILEI